MELYKMKKLAAIIFLALTASCFDSINGMLENLNYHFTAICVDGGVSASGNGRGWKNAYKTISEAVAAAPDGTDIWVKAGTYTPAATIAISKSVSIYGGFDGTESKLGQRSSNAALTVIDGDGTSQILYVTDGSLLIDGFTFSNGRNFNGGAISVEGSHSLTVNNCCFADNFANGGSGGAIYIYENGVASISNTIFIRNHANSAGAVFCGDGSVVISDSVFGNKDDVNDRNYANGSGGAISEGSNCSINIIRCSFYKNSAGAGGGAGYFSSGTIPPYIGSCNFIGNTASTNGGAIELSGASLTIENGYFQGNIAIGGSGGAIYEVGGNQLIINNTNISGNTCDESGGGIYSVGTDVTINNTNFSGNNCATDGAGIYYTSYTLSLNSCNFRGNSTNEGRGGAVCHLSDVESFIGNSWFYDNVAGGEAGKGGALYVDDGSSHNFVNLTFFSNSAPEGSGGAIYFNSGSHILYNSVLYNNTCNNDPEDQGPNICTNAGTVTLDYCYYNNGLFGASGTGTCVTSGVPFVSTTYGNSNFLYPANIIIDAGNNTPAVSAGISADLAGNTRFVNINSVTDTGNGTAPIIDMGTYERQ
jgi:predicted outer membrane repeat protein